MPVYLTSNWQTAMKRRHRHIDRRRMRHHREMRTGKRAALEQQDLAARVAYFLSRRADHRYRQAGIVGNFRQRNSRARRHRGDDVVSAGMTDRRQAVVLGADRDMQRARAGASGERGRQVADPTFDLEAGAVEHLAEPSACLLLLEAEFGMGMDAMAEIDQRFAALLDFLTGRVLGVHQVLLCERHARRAIVAAGARIVSIAPQRTC